MAGYAFGAYLPGRGALATPGSHPCCGLVVFFLSGMTLATIGLTWIYNDLEEAYENYILRNIINAFGFVCYSSGATIVAAGYGQYDLN